MQRQRPSGFAQRRDCLASGVLPAVGLTAATSSVSVVLARMLLPFRLANALLRLVM